MSAYSQLAALGERARQGSLTVPAPLRATDSRGARAERPAAVLLLFGVLDSIPATSSKPLVSADLDILLVQRAATLSNHPGQIAFPGGGVEPSDASFIAAALREAREETGLDPSGVEVLGMLPPVPVSVSNFMVTPVLGWWARQSPVNVVDYGESAQVFRVPVRDLLDPDNRLTATIKRDGHNYHGPAFTINDMVVWGFTAGILSHVLDELGWSVPWDASRQIPAPV